MPKATIICSNGIGDGLLMAILADKLVKTGYIVKLYGNSHLKELQNWFPAFTFCSFDEPFDTDSLFYLQNDNSSRSIAIKDRAHVFYASYKEQKHGPLKSGDYVAIADKSMVCNIASWCQKQDNTNGITPPKALLYRKEPKKVIFHFTSQDPKWSWNETSFIKVAKKLQKNGYRPIFISKDYKSDVCREFYFETTTLDSAATLLYESGFCIGNDSGIGHLASALGIPTLTISARKEGIDLWRPGWGENRLILPKKILPRSLLLNHWKMFITPHQVVKEFFLLEKNFSKKAFLNF